MSEPRRRCASLMSFRRGGHRATAPAPADHPDDRGSSREVQLTALYQCHLPHAVDEVLTFLLRGSSRWPRTAKCRSSEKAEPAALPPLRRRWGRAAAVDLVEAVALVFCRGLGEPADLDDVAAIGGVERTRAPPSRALDMPKSRSRRCRACARSARQSRGPSADEVAVEVEVARTCETIVEAGNGHILPLFAGLPVLFAAVAARRTAASAVGVHAGLRRAVGYVAGLPITLSAINEQLAAAARRRRCGR